jgi:hypothetical protein
MALRHFLSTRPEALPRSATRTGHERAQPASVALDPENS